MIRENEEKLVDLAYQNNIEIKMFDLVNRLGVSVLYRDKYFIGINLKLKKGIAYNEILAHELAHCVLKNFYLVSDKNALSRLNAGFYKRQATDWCVINLLPYDKLKKAIYRYCDDGNLFPVAETLSCSMEFLRYAINYYEIRGFEF